MFFLSSPLHYESADLHSSYLAPSKSNIFAAAYGENEDSEDTSEESSKRIRTCSWIEEWHSIFEDEAEIKINRKSKGGDEIIAITEAESPDESSPNRIRYTKKTHAPMYSCTIFDDLNQRIHEEHKNLEVLCNVEAFSYKSSGPTNFSPLLEENEKILPEIKEMDNSGSKTIIRKRPSNINTTISNEDRNHEYSYYLANCPEH